MALKLMYITNRVEVAKIVEASGVDWVFVDLEIRGKAERQGRLDAVLSCHDLADVHKIREALTRAELLVRINPPYEGTAAEVAQVIAAGADIVMLPYFKTGEEVEDFVRCVNKKAETCLLLETPEAVDNLASILSVPGIDYIHIGLNDLHLAYKMHFMFELLADGAVEKLCNKIAEKGIPYGFGGIARVGELIPPAESIIAEHYRLGSTMVILSRSFCNTGLIKDEKQISDIFSSGVKAIRDFEAELQNKDSGYFEKNRIYVQKKTWEVANALKNI
jgi:2-keto-3-deoxy-L-rhamnonate aldolase RhmA